MNRISTWLVVTGTTILLFAGVTLFSLVFEPIGDSSLRKVSEGTPLTLYLAVGLPIYLFEALFYCVASVELGARFMKSSLIGGIAGALVFTLTYYGVNNSSGILVCSLLILMLNGNYLALRKHSRKIAITTILAHKFILFFLVTFNLYI